MSYFLIYGAEGGTLIKQFRCADELKDYLEENFCDEPIDFMEYMPVDQLEINYGQLMIIKGDVNFPTPVKIVKSFLIN